MVNLEVEEEQDEVDLPPKEPWCPQIPDALDDLRKWKSKVQLTSWPP